MEAKTTDKALRQRIRDGKVSREDVVRRLAELAFGRSNDCVKLVLEDHPAVDKLDLSGLCELKRSEKGAVEVKLVDRLQALEQLLALAENSGGGRADFLTALQGGQETP